MQRCRNCLVPVNVPGVRLDADGVCNLCNEHEASGPKNDDGARKAREADLEQALKDCRGRGEYDCLVPLSGGKDSIFLLHRLKVEYGLRVLAFTTDINIPNIAWANIKLALDKLGVDHLVYRPSAAFYRKLFRYLLQHQEERGAVYTVSYVYAPLFEGDAIRVALGNGIPLVLAGYSPGQPEPERMTYEFSRTLICKTDWTPPELRTCGEFSEDELARFFDPHDYPAGTEFPRYLAPFHAWPYSQEEVMKKVVSLGLVPSAKHASPVHSNYPINWLLMYSDLKNFGYNPYAPEFAALIREGKANRREWNLMAPLVDLMIRRRIGPGREVTRSLKWLKLKPEQLRITRSRGAYDPVTHGAPTTMRHTGCVPISR
jgi:hypothetical protein